MYFIYISEGVLESSLKIQITLISKVYVCKVYKKEEERKVRNIVKCEKDSSKWKKKENKERRKGLCFQKLFSM